MYKQNEKKCPDNSTQSRLSSDINLVCHELQLMTHRPLEMSALCEMNLLMAIKHRKEPCTDPKLRLQNYLLLWRGDLTSL